VHVRHVSPRDDVAFPRHDQELAGSSREVCPSKHLSETPSQWWLHRLALHAESEVGRSQSID
jgi:hypothetical protein